MDDATVTLELCGVHKTFLDGVQPVPVLKDVNWTVSRKDTIAIVGPSGIGKSTLLHIMGALDRPDSGKLLLNGRNVLSLDDAGLAKVRNRVMGFVFQFHHMLPEFTALENVMMPARIAGISATEARVRSEELLDRMGLCHRMHHRTAQLSGGEQQRTALARALVMSPPFLLADEPTGNLDIDNSRKVHELLLEIHEERQCALVVVTHNMELAGMMQTQITLRDGLVANRDIRVQTAQGLF
ncbi:lipoprotein-releasing system ATP-binding protein [Desulfobotulus alkaliphilus]|uniref:Lipoprotein-releasing system ATP-binding protein n=1 Tax=Desulfobotulus alkaliphilus TaxID=622671 RepID=A0A562RGE3_9BACT|nr:ABC transporter ATP-binding protein [Desulfobotulus alkaliphilus]TWI68157.1 lipoprotein-releasing system ATP-binding protein [Desulfobotulus alkaliphilus]